MALGLLVRIAAPPPCSVPALLDRRRGAIAVPATPERRKPSYRSNVVASPLGASCPKESIYEAVKLEIDLRLPQLRPQAAAVKFVLSENEFDIDEEVK
ncbi:hypothetical protein E2562_038537 [Oryza meyeriana var. granulata]|uniref:Uncharacterized protein n=1 Tax=Oryza meyeriana var. granulata TaxID=110450 RepID=A0A6G1BRZ0_9ORYZ|nr:hypothetical protein E2562_038537 [Oryza meyeriana var. granulata]